MTESAPELWLRAAVHADPPEMSPDAGLTEDEVQAQGNPEARYRLVLAHYLAGGISLARTAELLEIPSLELRTLCLRLNVPLRTAPGSAEEAAADAATAESW